MQKHGLLIMDKLFGFPEQIITENGRYSILEYLHSEDNDGTRRFLAFYPPTAMLWFNTHFNNTIDEDDIDFATMYNWLTKEDIGEPKFYSALQMAWMIARELRGNDCDAI